MKIYFPNNPAGLASAKAIADPKTILVFPTQIVVLTGTDYQPDPTVDPDITAANGDAILQQLINASQAQLATWIATHVNLPVTNLTQAATAIQALQSVVSSLILVVKAALKK